MISSGFTNAPVSQFLVFGTVIGALLATLTDTRYYLHIQVVPHIWGYGQFWRFLTWQVSFWGLGVGRDVREKEKKARVKGNGYEEGKLIRRIDVLYKLDRSSLRSVDFLPITRH
jgi:hypothetical protein